MSKILKKITKKYKWLRFLNYKTTKLTVLSVALFGLCLSSGASFAKYRDENYGNGNAGAAKFEYGVIVAASKSIQEPKNSDNLSHGIHVFSCEFSLQIPTVEVSISYTIKLRLVSNTIDDFDSSNSGLSYSSFISDNDSGQFYYYSPKSEGSTEIVQRSGSLSAAISEDVTFSTNSWFKGEKTNETDNYVWSSSKVIEEKSVILFDAGTVSAGSSLIKYYKTVIFISSHKNTSNQFELENSQILYNYNVEQVVV